MSGREISRVWERGMVMDYMCGYYWNGEGEVSLVLKQLAFHGMDMPVLFACLAEGRTRKAFVEEMTEWFHKKAVTCCQKGEQGLKAMERDLEKQAEKHFHNMEMAAVFLCVGELFFLWGRGKQKIWLLNTRFGKPHRRALFSEEEQNDGEMLSGALEHGVGILLATKEFGEGIGTEQLNACLAVKELDRESKVEKRLKELGEESERKGKEHVAAVLVVTC